MADDPDTTKLREAARVGDLFEARLVASYLESQGIPTHIPNEYTFDALDGMATIWAQGVPVLVPIDRLEEAKRLIEERGKSGGDSP